MQGHEKCKSILESRIRKIKDRIEYIRWSLDSFAETQTLLRISLKDSYIERDYKAVSDCDLLRRANAVQITDLLKKYKVLKAELVKLNVRLDAVKEEIKKMTE